MDKYNLGTVGGINVTELFSGSVGSLAGNFAGKITLNDDITNYKFLIFDLYCYADGGAGKIYYSRVISVQQFTNLFNNADNTPHISFCWGYSSYNDFFEIVKNDTTTKVLNITSRYTQCLRIVGIN